MRACALCYCLSLSFEINPRPFGLFVCNIQHTVWICQRFWFLPMQRKFTATCQLFGKVFRSCSFWNNSKEAVLVIPNHLGWWTSWTSSLKKAEVSAMMARNQSMNWTTKYLDSPKNLLHKLESHWLVNPKNPFVTSPPPHKSRTVTIPLSSPSIDGSTTAGSRTSTSGFGQRAIWGNSNGWWAMGPLEMAELWDPTYNWQGAAPCRWWFHSDVFFWPTETWGRWIMKQFWWA